MDCHLDVISRHDCIKSSVLSVLEDNKNYTKKQLHETLELWPNIPQDQTFCAGNLKRSKDSCVVGLFLIKLFFSDAVILPNISWILRKNLEF